MTGIRTIVVNMPIHQDEAQYDLSNLHIEWLLSKWRNVERAKIDLSNTFDELCSDLDGQVVTELSLANTRARLRMTALFAIAGSNNGIVVGTGNKVEDFGIGFFTKYGDGGVDISPIADLFKSDVYSLGGELGVISEVLGAAPTDGLWNDGRTDEDQIGATYEEIEWAMKESAKPSSRDLSERERKVLDIYQRLNKSNSHKMDPIPVFKLYPDE